MPISSMCDVPTIVRRFNSVYDYVQVMKPIIARTGGSEQNDQSWSDNVSTHEAMRLAVEGMPGLASKMSGIVDHLWRTDISADRRKKYRPSLAGSRVSVPEYLGGSPTCMRQRMNADTAVQAITMYVNMTCSHNISASDMLKRGATILSLLEWLQATGTTVDLYLINDIEAGYAKLEDPESGAKEREKRDLVQVIRVESRPLDISTASFAIAHVAFVRQICYQAGKDLDWRGMWPNAMRTLEGYGRFGSSPEYKQHLAELIDMQPGDLYIPSVQSGDPIISRPGEWLQARIKQLGLSTIDSI
jgi:hypothetical protein